MATLPNPIDETYIDFLKRKFQGRNFSPEFRARNPGYFDMRGEDAPPTKATWETYYRKAKPKPSATSSQDDGGMLSPLDGGPPALGFWDDPGPLGDQKLKGLAPGKRRRPGRRGGPGSRPRLPDSSRLPTS